MRLVPPRPSRRALARVVASVAAAGFILGGLAQLRMETSITSFLPTDDPVVEQLNKVTRSFGGDPIVVLIEGKQPRQVLQDQQHLLRLIRLEGKLSRLPDVAAVYGPGTVLNQIAGQAQDLLAELSGRRDGIRAAAIAKARENGASKAEARQAGERAVRQFDAHYGSLIVQGLPAGLPTVRNPDFVASVVYGADGDPRPQWQFVVPNDESVAVLVRPRQGLDEQATQALVTAVRHTVDSARLGAARVTVTGVPVIATALSAQIWDELPLLGGIAILAIAGCFLLVPWAPLRRRLLPVASTLIAVAMTVAVFGWLAHPVSLAVLAFLSVLLGIGSYYPLYLAQRARRRVVVTVVTATAASFATLTLSPLPFVRDLGLTLALGVLIAAGTGAVLLGGRTRRPAPDEPAGVETAKTPRTPGRAARIVTLLGVAAVTAAGWIALPGLAVQGSFQRFAAGLPEMAEAQRVEDIVGASGELDIVLRGPDVLSPEAFAWASRAHDVAVAKHGDQLSAVLSPSQLLPFLGPHPTEKQIEAGVRIMPSYLTSAVFRSDHKVALLRFGVRLGDIGELRELRDGLRRVLPEPPKGYSVELTGLSMAAVRANELVAGDRLLGNLGGIVAAGVVLAVGLRRRSDTARAVLAAAAATGAGLAALWLLDITLNPLTVVFGSLTAAVACEFTVVLAEARRQRSRALRRSVLLAMGTSALGYAALTGSQLPGIREFGALLAGSTVLSLAAAWVITWATAPRLEPRLTQTAQADENPVEVAAR